MHPSPLPGAIMARRAPPGVRSAARIVVLVFPATALALSVPRAEAQSAGTNPVSRFTVEDGLANNSVFAIAQDTTGYLWVGTRRGLQRFDGYSFVTYSTLFPNAPAELAGPTIGLRIDRRGRLWVGMERGVFVEASGAGEITRFEGYGRLAPDSAGRLWFATHPRTLTSVDWNSPSPRATTIAVDLPTECCAALATTREGHVWIAPPDETSPLIRVDPATGGTQAYPRATRMAPTAVAEDAEGRMWVGGLGGVDVLEPGDDRFRSMTQLAGWLVGDVQAEAAGGVLVLSERGVARVDGRGRILETWDPREAFADAPLPPRSLLIDREGGFWLGGTAAGLIRVEPANPVFRHVSSTSTQAIDLASDFVMAVFEASDRSLWLGTLGGGAYRIGADDRAGSELAARRISSLPSEVVWDFAEDRAGTVWIGTSEGVCAASAPSTRCVMQGRGVADITTAPDGWMWVALTEHSAVAAFDPATGRVGPTLSGLDWPITVYADPASGELWIGGHQLYRARILDGRIIEPARVVTSDVGVGEPIIDIRRDRRGDLWIGSGRGLQRFDPASDRFVLVELPGLSGSTVFSIAEDPEGRLWLGTAHGLVQYHPMTGVARRFRRQDGILSGEFSRRASIVRATGEIVMGGLHGLTIFQPQQVTQRKSAPPIVFTSWERVTADGAVPGRPEPGEALRLGPADRAFTLEFAALTFAPGPARRYRYRLEGLDPDWIEVSDHAVTYATPPPGRYVFRVQAAGGYEGAWAEPGGFLALQVVPPFWRTGWFRATLVLLALSGLWALHRLRLRRVVATERLRLQIARDLHDEIGAGLGSIALLSDAVGASADAGGDQRGQLDRIAGSARGMMADLRDIVWAIDPDGDRLEDIVSRMRDVAADLLRDIEVDFRAPDAAALPQRISMEARRDLLRIYKEVLHNVARHARATAVEIRLDARDGEIDLVISDDGAGFDPAAVRAGTGLRSIRERAARIGAALDLTSRVSGGTTVRVTLKKT